ncbi:hypothetical protein BS47DRAFT_179175 [Hydnum rufescens UP504]|uniref:DUF6534 domain-containing protein n=1 Tax=Hydnum rufescens UP504 TaxID=1448309 RepID=A0A9P6ANJ9_9AGAM|nr:hypothetical protein BS47DRAFT_179175 [Hydnum rufescens UP504]
MRPTSGSNGGILLGGVLGNIIFGATTAQTILYFSRFPNDSRRTRTLVTVVWILEHYRYCDGFLRPAESEYTVAAIILVSVGECFDWFSSGILYVETLSIIPELVCAVRHGTGVYSEGGAGRKELFLKDIWLVALHGAADAVLDLGIAGSTTAFLYRSRTGFKSTDAAIKRIAQYSISTGLVTSVVTIQIMGVRLHSMALLGSLHMRSAFRKRGGGTIDSIHVSLSVIRRVDGSVPRRSMSMPPPESILDVMRTADDHEMLPISSDVKIS